MATEQEQDFDSASGPTDGLNDVNITAGQVLYSVYALFYNKKFGLFLILATGILSLLGILLPQAPSGTRDNPEAWSAFLEKVSTAYGGWTKPLAALGMFNMFTSTLFLIVMALLSLSILGCTVHRIPLLYRNAYRPRTHAKATFFTRARFNATVTTAASPADARDAVTEVAKKRHMRVIPDPEQPGEYLYVDKFHWAPFGTVISHLAFILIIIGFLISSFAGFRNEAFNLTVGVPEEVGFDTGLVAEATSFQDSYYEDGQPKDYVSHVVLYKEGQQVAEQDVRVNTPLSYEGVVFHQASFGISAVLTMEDQDGTTLIDKGVPLNYQTRDGFYTYGVVELPEDELEVFVISAASGVTGTDIAPGQIKIEIYPSGSSDPIDRQIIDAGQPTNVGGYTFTFAREAQYAGLIVKSDPGVNLVWIASTLLIIGSIMTMGLRHMRFWVRIYEDEGETHVAVASHDKRDLGLTRKFNDFTDAIAAQLDAERIPHA
ncbi:MAG: cytochrome c biogenesis protein ResB [Actinomycetaceae bacterium]|nr:cytochrome c biogenesis protein ResB [Actinomycetaceae bacterium]